ncbi:placenta-expressed transcript 1 protein-like [Moschus berezovskii]|uniref:placenta-expressed transcript 1 protein-like n=1 Tax=Moschus berezovskii TaxID=68408 RepID=UPI002443D085|nr:placenta-expressed transcript 1 protein-like [Moschus berezovskii]
MAILRSLLLPLGLLLCLWLLCSPASCTNPTAKCKLFSSVTQKTLSLIYINSIVYKSNTLYTLLIHVNSNISSVVLEARNQHNSIIGSWHNPSEYCEDSAKYDLKDPMTKIFKANWTSPNSTDITAAKINIYTVNHLRNAELSSLTLLRAGAPFPVTIKHFPTKHVITISDHKPTTTHKKPTTAHPKPTTTQQKTTTTHPIPTTTLPKPTTTHHTSHPKLKTTHNKHTTRSSANRVFLSPVRDAIQILLIFLTSTLLF